jgi:alkylation response protein AidB-like acyl-CoA dehydrogenase
LAAQALVRFGSDQQKAAYLPGMAAGDLISCAAISELAGQFLPQTSLTRFDGEAIYGAKQAVADGGIADIAIVAAAGGGREPQSLGLFVVDLRHESVSRQAVKTLDGMRGHAHLTFDRTPATPLPLGEKARATIDDLLDRAAVLYAFEQLGGSDACLDMAVQYSRTREAFGRKIGSFQALKHKLADMYVRNEIARSNAYYGAWALAASSDELPVAAALARLSGTQAFSNAAKENIHVHGGLGFTWEADCHLYYRRAKQLALVVGSERVWRDRMLSGLIAQAAAQDSETLARRG